MRKTLRVAAGVALAVILLSGCRYDATYTIHTDNTVSGRIYTAGWLDPGDPTTHDTVKAYIDADADVIADAFTTSVKSAYTDGAWYGYFIDLTDEPIPSFADPAQAAWDIQIIRTGDAYRVNGFTFEDDDDPPRPQARDNGGYITLDVRAPGELEIAISASSATESPCRIQWDLLNVVPVGTTPYAICDATPPEPPDPDPAVTVVITPDPIVTPEPVVTPVVTPVETPSESPSPVADGGESDSIPTWVWAVGGGLLVALAAMVGFAIANRKPAEPPAPAPKAKSKAKAVEEPAEDEAEDEPEDEPEDEEPEEKPKKKPPSKK